MSDKNHLRTFFYDNTAKLKVRLLTWKKYGTNTVPFLTWIRKNIPIANKTTSLLDVGCGTGQFLKEAVQTFPKLRVSGLDLSPAMVQESKRKLPPKSIIMIGDVESLPFKNNMFDVVTAIHMLYHVPNQKKALLEMMRVTKQGGVIFITTTDYEVSLGLNKLHYEGLKKFEFPSFMQNTVSYLRCTPQKVDRLLNTLHLSSKKHIYQNYVHFPNIKSALSYYQSAMMYRQSHGLDDKRIKLEKWNLLYKYVRDGIALELQRLSYFHMPGKVVGYRIII
jgi:ubiquinone/menaquinone biosynthesis C-methylase UbiE